MPPASAGALFAGPAERAWALLRALARRASDGRPVAAEVGLRLDDGGALVEGEDGAWIVARPASPRGWEHGEAGALARGAEAEALFDLYLPLVVGDAARTMALAHLAQSLDGRIATVSGASQFISSEANLRHAHRLRALCDAVVVGRETVHADNPRLTTRLVPGACPVRVVIDPARSLPLERHLFSDGAARTLLVCTPEAVRGEERHGLAELVTVEPAESGGRMAVGAIVEALARRGLRRLFIEGGGVTVSRFVEARALTRLQIAVAPIVLGSGRPALSLPVIAELSEAVALECRHVAMGRDLLFDCVFPRA